MPRLEPPPEIGDVVILNSGGPKMTVVEISDNQVRVVWVDDDNALEVAWFPRACVSIYRGKPDVGVA